MASNVYIGLGANLNQPAEQIKWALAQIKILPHVELIAVSSLYASKPLGPQDQPDYVNAAAKISTKLHPEELLQTLQKIELDGGRVRKSERWGARTLDLDILLIDKQVINTEMLTVPHYDMKNREFVVYPLLEIDNTIEFPDGKLLQEITKHIPLNDLSIIENLTIDNI